jgi:hypothetical protein
LSLLGRLLPALRPCVAREARCERGPPCTPLPGPALPSALQCQSPSFVTTKLSKLRHASLLVPTPDTWAAAAVGCIKPGVASAVPYWPHALQVGQIEVLLTLTSLVGKLARPPPCCCC